MSWLTRRSSGRKKRAAELRRYAPKNVAQMRKLIDEHEKVNVLFTMRQIDMLIEHTFAEDDLLNALQVSELKA